MSENWTKGEWTTSTWIDQPNNRDKPMVSAEGITVAITHPNPACPDNECEANAHLIAAAPDMYEIVKAVAHIGVDFGYGEFQFSEDDIAKARQVAAKARGEHE